MPILVKAAGVVELGAIATPQRAHLLARLLQVIGMNEVDAAAADHLLRPEAENGFAARADLNDIPVRIHDHDQILRGVEDLPPLLQLLLERSLGPPLLCEAARR